MVESQAGARCSCLKVVLSSFINQNFNFMAVLYGAEVFQEGANPSNLRYDIIGNNSEVFTRNDIVTTSGGDLVVASATSVIFGVVAKTQTLTSDNETVAKVRPGFVDPQADTIFLMGANGDFSGNDTDVGTYYKITGATGAQQVDQASGVQTTTSRIVEIVKVDPRGIGGTGSGSGLREVLVRFVKTPFLNVGGPA